MTRKIHKKRAENWVKNHLGGAYSVHPARVRGKDKLHQWGLIRDEHFADLAKKFNQATLENADWRGGAVTPPQLQDAVQGGTVSDLANFLSDNLSANSLATFHIPSAEDIQDFLVGELNQTPGDKFTKDSKFGIDINLDSTGILEGRIEKDFAVKFKIGILGLISYCINGNNISVRQVAICMNNYIVTRGRIVS